MAYADLAQVIGRDHRALEAFEKAEAKPPESVLRQ